MISGQFQEKLGSEDEAAKWASRRRVFLSSRGSGTFLSLSEVWDFAFAIRRHISHGYSPLKVISAASVMERSEE